MRIVAMRTWAAATVAIAAAQFAVGAEEANGGGGSELTPTVHLSETVSDSEKSGVYKVGQPIQIFQSSLTSHRIVMAKSPMDDFAVNCHQQLKDDMSLFKKEISTLRKMTGDRVFTSAYKFRKEFFDAKKSKAGDKPQVLCVYKKGGHKQSKKTGMTRAMRRLERLVNEDYRINLMLPDGTPAKEIRYSHNMDLTKPEVVNGKGLSLHSVSKTGEAMIHIMWRFIIIRTPPTDDGSFNIRAFYAYPQRAKTFTELNAAKKFELTFDVEVIDVVEDAVVEEKTREVAAQAKFWVIGIVVVLAMSVSTGVILIRTVFKDIALANKDIAEIGEFLMSAEDKMMETGWKLVYADVFRAPGNSIALCASIGFGFQVLFSSTFSAIIGVSIPGRVAVLSFLIYVFSGLLGGYISAMFYKSFGGERWKLCVGLTHFLYPMIVLVIMSVANTTLWITSNSSNEKSESHDNTGAIPFTSLLEALAVWIFVGFPLTFVGSYFGFKRAPFEYPVRTNLIPRQIPTQTFTSKLIPRALLGGGAVFAAFFIQLFFFNDDLINYGTSSAASARLVVATVLSSFVCAEMGLISTYRQLTSENYQWWWQSMFVTGFSGVYVFTALCLIWFLKFVSSPAENTYGMTTDSVVNGVVVMCLITSFSICVALMNGFIGFISSWFFVRKIYGAVRVD